MNYFASLLLLCGLLTIFPTWAQPTGSIQGRVTTSDGDPAEAVSVGLSGLALGGLTNSAGYYTIGAVPAGTYALRVSSLGLKAGQQPVTVAAGQRVMLDFRLAESTAELQEVLVQGARLNRFNRPGSEYVAKMPLRNLENPQVYATVGKELLTEQLVFTVDDATRNVPGLQKMWEATGRSGDGGAFYASRGFVSDSRLRNGVAGNVTSDIDAINLERLEVLKGPSATLFGSTLTSYGGLLNRVTKKPLDAFGGELTTAAGSYGFHRVSADVNLVDQHVPADQPKQLALRLNTAYTYEDSFQNAGYPGFTKSLAVAPSLQYRPTDRLTVNLDAEIYQGTNVGRQIIYLFYPSAELGADRADQLPLDYRQSYLGPGLTQDSRTTNLFGQVQYRLSPGFTSTTYLTSSHSYSDGFGPYFYLVPGAAGLASLELARNDQSTQNSRRETVEAQQLFNGDFRLGGLRNRVVLGLDFLRTDVDITYLNLGGFIDQVPVAAPGLDYRTFRADTVRAVYARMPPTRDRLDFQLSVYSAFLSDVLNLTEQLSVLAAVRLDHFENSGGILYRPIDSYGQTTASPKFGVVFQPVKNRVALFANYQNSFTNLGFYLPPGGLVPVLAQTERANQWEAGVKLDAAGGRLSATASYYDIRVRNILRSAATQASPLAQVQDGTQWSRGAELNLTLNPVPGLNFVGGFAYNYSVYVNARDEVNGRRPDTASSPYLANAWLSYRQPEGRLRGLGLGVGGNYASDNLIQSTNTNTFTLPSYTVLNASAFYDQPRYRLSVRVDNLTDQHYWIGYNTMNPQKLRSIIGAVAYKF